MLPVKWHQQILGSYLTHYGKCLATMASADFCSIMTGVATLHAACIAVGFCGLSIRFQIALNQTPIVSQTAF